MTVQELYDRLGLMIQQQPRIAEHELYIYTDDPGLVGFNVAKVKGIANGFDWYNGMLLIYSEKKIFSK